jgi:ABC-type nitrate/sulfonate/bicarbonate transport system permease component
MVSSIFLITPPHIVVAQSSEVAIARQALVQALQAIQTAEQQGAANSDLLPLTAQLNRALQYEETADTFARQGNTTLAQQYAIQSINISTQVSFQAQSLGNTAQTATLYRTTLSYVLAVLLALLSAVLILETDRIRRRLRRRSLLKARIDYGGNEHAS